MNREEAKDRIFGNTHIYRRIEKKSAEEAEQEQPELQVGENDVWGTKRGKSFKEERVVHGVQCSETVLDEGYRASAGSPPSPALLRPPLQTSERFFPKCTSDQVTFWL